MRAPDGGLTLIGLQFTMVYATLCCYPTADQIENLWDLIKGVVINEKC